MVKKLLKEQSLKEMSSDVVKKIPSPNRDIVNSISIEKSWRTSGKFNAYVGGGSSISILDLVDKNKAFDNEKDAEKYVMSIVKMWIKFLDKYYVG